jgi:hypothetical protein
MRAAIAATVRNSLGVKKRGSEATASLRAITRRVFSFQDSPELLARTS